MKTKPLIKSEYVDVDETCCKAKLNECEAFTDKGKPVDVDVDGMGDAMN